jgi:hypothetical protein
MAPRLLLFTALAGSCCGVLLAGAALRPAVAGPAAVVYCTSPGLPVGCVGRPGVGAGAPGVGVAPGVGAGAPGVGVRPAAGPGVGPNAGGPVNRPGRR